jgi:Tubulin-tyrosine ligase family
MFQDPSPLPENQPFAGQFPDWSKGQSMAQFTNTNEPARQKRIRLYAQVKTRKNNTLLNLLRFISIFFSFQRTFIIPQDLKILRQVWQKYYQRNVKWIIKPPASARGTGIKVVNRWSQIPKRKPLIVQR